jgi:GntR family transcriptional regulator
MSDVYVLPGVQRPPLAAQAASIIRRAIEDERWPVGDRLPGEPQLATELGISRATLRDAIRMLVSDGLLDRRHGVGTFVLRVPTPTIERGIDELFSLGSAIEQLGYAPTAGRHSSALESSPAVVSDELRLRRGAHVVHLTRVRLADGRPVILCDDYFSVDLLAPHRLTADHVEAEVVSRGSLYAWFEERLGLPIDTALTRIEPVAASPAVASSLAVPRGAALLRLRQTHSTANGQPVLYSENVHNSEVMQFHVLRRRPQRGRDAV